MDIQELRWPDVAELDSRVLCGLVVKARLRVRSETHQRRWHATSAEFRAVVDAVRAAVLGGAPARPKALHLRWLDRLVEENVAEPRWLSATDIVAIRALARAGLTKPAIDANYALAMIILPVEDLDGTAVEQTIGWYRDNPELMRAVVRRMVDGEEQRGIVPDTDDGLRGTWQSHLVSWGDVDPLVRSALIDACLHGLIGSDVSTYGARWHLHLWTRINPLVEELIERQDALRRLLGSTAPSNVRIAVEQLTRLSRHDLMDDAQTAIALVPAMSVRHRTTARQAAKLLGRIAVRSPAADIVPAARAALSHADPDVQRRAAQSLIAVKRHDVLNELMDTVEPSIQHEFGRYPHGHRPDDDHGHQDEDNRTPSPPVFVSITAEALCGLVIEHVERIVAERGDMPIEAAHWWSLVEAVRAASQGHRPVSESSVTPSWVRSCVRWWMRDLTLPCREYFFTVRTLERLGLITLDPDATYVSAMISWLAAPWDDDDHRCGSPAAWCRADPELVDRALWRIFTEPGVGTVSLTSTDRYADDAWLDAIVTMIDEGRLDRGRVIDEALATLGRDWSDFRLRWFSRLVQRLQPTPRELVDRQHVLRRLLRQEQTAAVTLALTMIKSLSERALLDDSATVPELTTVLTRRTSSLPLAALRLLDAIRRRTHGLDISGAARAALQHPAADVQRAAVNLLDPTEIASSTDELVEFLDPVVRHELGFARPRIASRPGSSSIATPTTIQPVTEVDLLDRLAAMMEDPSDPVELELVLARLARHTNPSSLQPLSKRASAIINSGPGNWHGPEWLPAQIARLVLVGVGRPTPHLPLRDPIAAFLIARLHEIEVSLTGKAAAGPLLATPDDLDGWVSADALVRRLMLRGAVIRPIDLLAALLRLHPDGRAEALAELTVGGAIGGEVGAAVRHALGGVTATPADVRDPDLWVAASRARVPYEDDPTVIAAGLVGAGQGRPIAPVLRTRQMSLMFGGYWVVDVGLEPVPDAAPLARNPAAFQPTAWHGSAWHNAPSDHDGPDGSWYRWMATVWPHEADHFLITTLSTLFGQVEWSSGPDDHILQALQHHPGRFGSLAHTALAFGLSTKAAQTRILAADVMIGLALAHRVSGQELGTAMAGVANLCIATRWAEALRNIAAGHAVRTVIDALTTLLPHLRVDHHGIYALLDVLHQEQLRAGVPTTDPNLRTYLASFAGPSRAARSARALLLLTP